MITLLACLFGSVSMAMADIFATYNVRTDSQGDRVQGDGWEKRVPYIADLIRYHQFDVVGTQEAQPHQVADLKKVLPEYVMSGFGRDDGAEKGEYIAIFFKESKYRKLDEGRYWFSPTPEVPGKGWDAALPRICAWVKLEDVKSRKVFYFFCSHFDHRGEQAKVESSKLMLAQAKRIAGDLPAVLCGDFNSNQESEGYKIFQMDEFYEDTFDTAKVRYARAGTFNRFNPLDLTPVRIDHIFVSAHFSVERYGILTDTYFDVLPTSAPEVGPPYYDESVAFPAGKVRFPSDHFPVIAEVEWK